MTIDDSIPVEVRTTGRGPPGPQQPCKVLTIHHAVTGDVTDEERGHLKDGDEIRGGVVVIQKTVRAIVGVGIPREIQLVVTSSHLGSGSLALL